MFRRLLITASAVALVAAGLGVLAASPAGASDLTVTTTADGGAGSLRQAIETLAVNAGGDTVILAAGATYQLTDCGAGDLSHGSTPLTIQGNGATIQQTCVGARVLDQGAAKLTLLDVTITGGNTSGPGAGVRAGDAVDITRSTIRDNVSGTAAAGGGLSALGGGVVTVRDSSFTGNTARNGGGLFSGGSLTVINSTFTGNHADGGPGTGVGGAFEVDTGATLTLVYSTIVANTANSGAGANGYLDSETTGSIFGTVIAQGNCYFDNVSTTVTSHGYNVHDSTATGCKLSDATDKQADPLLGALAANGGPTQTLLPLAGSPLIDGIPGASCQADGATGITADQRAFARPAVAGSACDVGAVEVPPAPPAPPVVQPSFTG